MSQIVLKDASVVVNSVDLSDHVTQVVINYDGDQVEITAMGDTSHKFTGGLYNITMSVDFQQDFAASSVDATLHGLVNSTTNVVVKPTSGAVSATNPSYTLANTYVSTYQPINGSVGDLSTTSVEFVGGTLTRAES